jgi:hypothetical protein
MPTTDDLLDASMSDCKKPTDLIGENCLLKQLYKKSLVQLIPAEMTENKCFPEERR